MIRLAGERLQRVVDRHREHLARDEVGVLVQRRSHVAGSGPGQLDPVGDVYLFWRMRRLADSGLQQPLLTLSGDLGALRHCRVRLTDFGRQVRNGAANHVEVNGIDDWVGGVHLRASTGSPWYRRNGELIPRKAL